MQLNEELLKIPTQDCCGVKCWTPTGVSKAIKMHRNTVNGWVRKTKAGEMDMPLFSNPKIRSRSYIPIKKFLEWYNYSEQN